MGACNKNASAKPTLEFLKCCLFENRVKDLFLLLYCLAPSVKTNGEVLKHYCYLYSPWTQDNRLEISLCEFTAIQQMQVPIKFGYFWPPGSLFTKKNKRFVASCLFFPNGRLTRKSIQMLPYFAEYFAEKNFLCRIKCRKSKFFQGPFLLIKATFK